MSEPTFTLLDARAYTRRRRIVLSLVVVALVSVVGWRAALMLDRAERRALCERQRASTELIASVDRRIGGLVQVRSHSVQDEPVVPARGDVVIGPHGSYLVGDGRVLALDPSCAKAVP